MMIAAIFDLDGTLYTGHIINGIARHHRHHRTKLLHLYSYLAIHISLLLPMRLGLVSEETVREVCAAHLGWTVRGWTPERAASAFIWIAQNYVLPLLRPDVVQRLEEHRVAGHRIILVSGTPVSLLAEIGRQLGIAETVGTPLIHQNNHYTGGSEAPICQGANKVQRLEIHIQGTQAISWSQSYAYADSYTDLPLLKRCGHPVAVYPDPKLVAYAQNHGWEIIA